MNEAGQKKWKPTTLSGRLVASPISVIERPDVLEARIAWPGVAASSSENTACLTSIFSGTASMTKSTSPKASYDVVPVIRESVRSTCSAPCVGRELVLGDELAHLALGHLAGLLQPGVDELLVDVLEQDGDVGGGHDLGDLPAHDARADHRGFEDEHGRTLDESVSFDRVRTGSPPCARWRSA